RLRNPHCRNESRRGGRSSPDPDGASGSRMTAPLLEPVNQLATNIVEFTVSELSFPLRRTVEENFEHVRVRGEISGFKGASGSGHCYFTLKDSGACLDAVVWRLTLQRLR